MLATVDDTVTVLPLERIGLLEQTRYGVKSRRATSTMCDHVWPAHTSVHAGAAELVATFIVQSNERRCNDEKKHDAK